jgi:DNA-binding LytR/AlgR family response regulator
LTYFSNGDDFLKDFTCGSFDLVFMDIYMKKISGVDTAKKMRLIDNDCLLVFLTASEDFMSEAFSCHAFEYVTKPFSPERIYLVLQEAWEKVEPAPKYIQIVYDQKTIPILIHDIRTVLTDQHYLLIGLTNNSTLRCRMTMSGFLEQADDPHFLLINRGILLNIEYITGVEENCCVMNDGSSFPIRVRDRAKIAQLVHDYTIKPL